uniref:Venom protein n=1 Tax=Ampulex compressa TaxID=860918 RepID=A0A1W6EVR4_AMPCP|nr:venom protein [Ampulex compressa]
MSYIRNVFCGLVVLIVSFIGIYCQIIDSGDSPQPIPEKKCQYPMIEICSDVHKILKCQMFASCLSMIWDDNIQIPEETIKEKISEN